MTKWSMSINYDRMLVGKEAHRGHKKLVLPLALAIDCKGDYNDSPNDVSSSS
jgi:hypothetical protein